MLALNASIGCAFDALMYLAVKKTTINHHFRSSNGESTGTLPLCSSCSVYTRVGRVGTGGEESQERRTGRVQQYSRVQNSHAGEVIFCIEKKTKT